ncbi:MAG: hypothetical protein CEN89_364 [Candidatus Berkelbacteria bacterium Licking1014_7]|uniref:YdbS-like PH domain-containing protein n=1 Tax=Candidatus Berkelbacteria bacterium Licking1014_7 TaxID=2017147 RepID=A0A554LK22_9BACT|nr:MAG: hypothetical protein CEN89_364 [Candidatus Berkelbacteria bacterium Licking1014_7]
MEQITFEGQKPDENILMHGKKHPFVLSKIGLVFLALALLVVALFVKFGMSTIPSISFLLLLFIGGIVIARQMFIYTHSIYILTDKRIISLDQTGFFARRMSESGLDKIVNVSHEIKGAIKTLLNFGNVIIQTQGSGLEGSVIKLYDIPEPDVFQQKIVSAASEFSGGQIEVD